MHLTLSTLLMTLVCSQTPQAHCRTANFVVYAPTAEMANLVGASAERWRADLAKLWLGSPGADWTSPCEIQVTLSMDMLEGNSAIAFAGGCVATQKISIKGPLDLMLNGPLPHELTHILFAHHFGVQPPRWADEGGALLSEGKRQTARQSKAFRTILGAGKNFALRRLMEMKQYPDDVACLYAQSHSVTRFLVDAKGTKAFLAFVSAGVERGWDEAIKNTYGYKCVEQLEAAWLGWAVQDASMRTE